jgi:hypothetical protein
LKYLMLKGSRILSIVRICLITRAVSMLCSIAVAKPEDSRPSYRSVIVHVVDERGESMPDVNVQLLGTGRDALQGSDIDSQYNQPGVWRFVSDARGRCTVRFGCFKGFDSEKLVGRNVPGWGRFNLIAEAGHLRGVSLCIMHEPDGENTAWNYGNDEWVRKGAVRTLHHPVVVTLRMRRGLSVVGRVIDADGRPVRDFDIGAEHDLGSLHHTGYGNEIFRHSTTSKADGRFVLPDIFPNTFYLKASLREEKLPVWVRTQLRGKWSSVPVDRITPRRGEKAIRMTLVVSNQLPYRYSGQLRDEESKPIVGAAVVLGISRHREIQDWEDGHGSLSTHSDDEGRFEFRSATQFVRFLDIQAAGFVDYAEEYEEKDMKAPAKWNITLHRP